MRLGPPSEADSRDNPLVNDLHPEPMPKTGDLLEEAIRIRRVPGIAFADGPAGRRAVVAGSGLDVWEIVATWQHEGKDFELLRQSYPWLTDPQLRAALSYYELHPEEIEERLARERQWTPERVARELPLARPRKRRRERGPRVARLPLRER